MLQVYREQQDARLRDATFIAVQMDEATDIAGEW